MNAILCVTERGFVDFTFVEVAEKTQYHWLVKETYNPLLLF